MDLRSNKIVLEFGHRWVNIVNIRLWLRLIYSICHDSTVTYFFQCMPVIKWHTLFFDTLLKLKMIHSVVWHVLDTRNDTLSFYDTLLLLKMAHSVLWHTLGTGNDTVCFFSVSNISSVWEWFNVWAVQKYIYVHACTPFLIKYEINSLKNG